MSRCADHGQAYHGVLDGEQLVAAVLAELLSGD